MTYIFSSITAFTFTSMSSSTRARTLSIKSNVKRADCKTWNDKRNTVIFIRKMDFFIDYMYTFGSKLKRKFKYFWNCKLTWSCISVVMAGIFSPPTVKEQIVLELCASVEKQNQTSGCHSTLFSESKQLLLS